MNMTNPNSLIGLRKEFDDFRKTVTDDIGRVLFDIMKRVHDLETRIENLEKKE